MHECLYRALCNIDTCKADDVGFYAQLITTECHMHGTCSRSSIEHLLHHWMRYPHTPARKPRYPTVKVQINAYHHKTQHNMNSASNDNMTSTNGSTSDLSTSTQDSMDRNVSAARKLRRMKRRLLLDYVANTASENIHNDDASQYLSLVSSVNPVVLCHK